MSDKDFLSQFSGNGTVPESFRQEERKPVNKQKKPINKVLIIVLCALLLVVALVVYLVFFAPKIEMPNFEGKTKTDVAAWVKQQGIQTSGVIFEEDYYFDYDENVIISQSVEAGKKVKENVKLTFVSSLGADPDELIKTPDLMNMTKAEIQDWISKNKLTKTKVTTSYSDDVEEGNVISFAYSGCDEETFTRSSTLKISVSKGPAPAGTISVEDFTKKAYEAVETWADSKKVKLTKIEKYSDTITAGLVISQSIESGKTMKENETLEVVVSKGKAVTIIDFTGMNETEISRWAKNNGIIIYPTYEYSDIDKDEFVTCTPKATTVIGTGDEIDVVISLGKPNLSPGLTSEAALKAAVEEANRKGAELELVHDSDKYDDAAPGTLIYYETENDVGDHVHYYLSKGKNIYIDAADAVDLQVGKDESTVRTKLEDLGLTYEVTYANGTVQGHEINKVMKIYYGDGTGTLTDVYIGQDVTIHVVVCDKTFE